jgi:uncharacterized protein (TIGR02996 family)
VTFPSAERFMPEEVELLAAVLREPDADAPRLAYAAWLRRAGGPANLARAELIGVQTEIEGVAEEDRRWPELARRERELLGRWAAVWEKPLRDLLLPSLFRPARWLRARLFGRGGAWRFHRGFIEEIDTSAAGFLEEDAILVGRTPVRRAVLNHATSLIGALAADPRLDNLLSLHLVADVELDEEMEGLRQAAAAEGLTVLELRYPRVQADLGDLFATLRSRADDAEAHAERLDEFRTWRRAGPRERERLRELARRPRLVQRLTETDEQASHAEMLRLNDWVYLGDRPREAGVWAVAKTYHDLEDPTGLCRRLLLFKRDRVNPAALAALKQSPHFHGESPA